MSARPWIAIFLLINYLMVVGLGCINRPEDQHELVLIQTNAADYSYQQCRYLRMDGLENFLTEAMANHYQKSSESPKHHLISVVNGIDAHCLPDFIWPCLALPRQTALPLLTFQLNRGVGVHTPIDAPPWIG